MGDPSATVVVTGAGGLVGRAVCADLRRAGFSVVPLVHRERAGTPVGSRALDLSRGSRALLSVVSTPPEAVVHLAAAVPHAEEYPDTEANAEMTRRMDAAVIEACDGWKARLVYASGCSLYAPSGSQPKDECAPVAGRSPYLSAKAETDLRLRDVPEACIMRISAPYGPGLRARVVLARFIEAARAGQPLCVWGDGRREQDFVSTADVARFVTVALQERAAGVFNVCTGDAVRMLDLATLVVDTLRCGEVVQLDREDPLAGNTARYSAGKAIQLGWRPVVSLAEGIAALAEEPFGP